MELEFLQQHVRTLATSPETDAPVISCYLELNKSDILQQLGGVGCLLRYRLPEDYV